MNGTDNETSRGCPPHQRVARYLAYPFAGALFIGSVLSVYRNSLLVPPLLTYAGTVIVALSWILLQRRLKSKPLIWQFGSKQYLIRKLGIGPTLFSVDMVFTLWLPRITDAWPLAKTALSNAMLHLPFKRSEKVVILLADFDGPDPQNYRVTQNIYEILAKSTQKYPNLEVRLLGEPITFSQGTQMARAKGERANAGLLLWGSYGRTSDAVQVSVSIEVLRLPSGMKAESAPTKCEVDTSARVAVYPIEELNSFHMQIDLSRQLSSLTFLTLGIALYKANDLASSINYLSESISEWGKASLFIEPSNTYFWRGDAYLAKRDADNAIADFSTVIELQPTNVSAYNNRGNSYELKGDWSRAQSDYTEAIRIGGSSCLACAYTNRGNLYADRGDYKDAVTDYTAAIRLNPILADAYDSRGHAYSHLGQHEKAVADNDRAIRLNQNTACFFNTRGEIFERQVEYDDALIAYTQAIRLGPKSALFRKNRGWVYFAKGNYRRAIVDITEAIRLDSAVTETRRAAYAEAYYKRGRAYAANREFNKAIEDYTHALAFDRNFADAYHERAHAFWDRGDGDRAVADFTQAIRLDSNPGLYLDRGWLYEEKKFYGEALAGYSSALAMAEDSSIRNDALNKLKSLKAKLSK
jgi:tetratricopeptide (TPR) repeat protein